MLHPTFLCCCRAPWVQHFPRCLATTVVVVAVVVDHNVILGYGGQFYFCVCIVCKALLWLWDWGDIAAATPPQVRSIYLVWSLLVCSPCPPSALCDLGPNGRWFASAAKLPSIFINDTVPISSAGAHTHATSVATPALISVHSTALVDDSLNDSFSFFRLANCCCPGHLRSSSGRSPGACCSCR